MGVYKEGKNWKVQVYYKDWQGNRKRKQKRGFRTKGEAKEWERDFLQQQSQGVDIEFGNFLEIYYKDMDVRLRENTMYTKRYIIDLKIKPYFEKKILSEITVADVRAWQNELLTYKDKNGKGYSPTYLKTVNCQLTAIFNYAMRYYNLQDNPCRKAGAIGKTTSCVNLAVGLAKAGKKVLVIDNDPQGSMTASLGYHNPDELPITLATILTKIVEDEPFENTLGILHHQEGIDLIPANIELSGMEVSLVNIMSRELVLKQYIERMREEYDYILIDCMPSLGMLTINALASVDAVIIPVQAAYLPVKGLEQLIRTIGKVRRQLNKQLKIGGILITMVDNRTNYARDISDLIFDEFYARDTSRKIRFVFKSKGMSGKHLTGTVIYGYLWDEKREHWLVDEEAAEVVRRIFSLTLE